MKELTRTWHCLHPSDQLLLLVHTAKKTTDAALFQRLLGVLDEVIAQAVATVDSGEVRARLEACSGTGLEPFTLNERNLELTSRLAQLAFSKRYAQTLFRVVSEQSVGSRGGMILSAGGKDRFMQRFMRRDDKFDYGSCWYWAPSSPMPAHLLGMAMFTETETSIRTCERAAFVVETDVRLRKDFPVTRVVRTRSTRDLLAWSPGSYVVTVVNGVTTAPLDLRVAFESNPDKKRTGSRELLVIEPTSPESIMRFSALAASGSVLHVDTENGGAGKARLKIRLGLPNAESGRLSSELERKAAVFEDIFRVSHDIPLQLDDSDLTKVIGELSPKNLPMLKESKAA